MFCFQCEQTMGGMGCGGMGMCGKSPSTALLQDLLVYLSKGISMYAHRARQHGVIDEEVDVFVLEALFTTVTNVNFDDARMMGWIDRALKVRAHAKELYQGAIDEPEQLGGPATFDPPSEMAERLQAATTRGVPASAQAHGKDIATLIELYVYGLKGAAAYAHHAWRLGKRTSEHFARYHEALSYLGTSQRFDFDELLGRCLDAGAINLEAMELLDGGNTAAYGHPEPTSVRVEPIKGKAILVSGHDLRDLKDLLEQTKGKGINVYTHGEMLPAHAYPQLKKYEHLAGNYGGAWQDQRLEFEDFPGAILMTTNCIQMPQASYGERIFTTGLVAWPGVKHVEGRDFEPVITAALAAEGFAADAPEKTIMVGFGRDAVLSAADVVVEAVKSGAIRHFFLVGGCDGAKTGRDYYTRLSEKVPEDCMILTLGCGKYRFNKQDFGTIGALPRLLDVGQCNDAYSAIKIATALASAFDCGVNELPLSLILSWYEQKAVAVLLTLLHLGIKGIRLGPSLPAFVSPKVLGILVEKFDIKPISTAEADLEAILGSAA